MGNIKVSQLPTAEQIKDEDLLYIGEKDTSSGGYRSRKASVGQVKRAIEEDLSLNETNRYSYRYGWPDYERAFVVQFPKNTDTTYTLEEDSLVAIKRGDLYLPDYTNCKTPLSLLVLRAEMVFYSKPEQKLEQQIPLRLLRERPIMSMLVLGQLIMLPLLMMVTPILLL